MRFYLNEASIQGQFEDDAAFRPLLEALLAARTRSPLLGDMRTTPGLADRKVSHERSVREVVRSWKGSPAAGALFAWIGRTGPFIEDDRLDELDDLFHCLGVDVTDGGLGEAGRRVKAGHTAAVVSFPGGRPDFAQSPLLVVHGFEQEPFGTYPVENYWTANAALDVALAQAAPASNWREMVEAARARFAKLVLPDAIYQDGRLAREPFDPIIRDRFYALLGHLEDYMQGRNEDGSEGTKAQDALSAYFQGDRALFSPESPTNQRDYRSEMTFSDPTGGQDIFAHWHGKISHRVFRLHFQWPVLAASEKLKVLYLGPKLTKS